MTTEASPYLTRPIRSQEEVRAGKWQPIETAPKDGTKVLIFVPAVTLGDKEYPAIQMVSKFKGYWWDAAHLEPTHWQPLPASPHTEGGREGT